ncbi:serine kinase [Cytobacillus sp. BC1816]|uniref:serine kinase n=1 Tax=Cytobacillus sp. BC1816 TaxID=3440154 RepID=UPI003F50DFCE
MRLYSVILLILLGSFLIGLTIDELGKAGNTIMNLIGSGLNFLGVLIARNKKERQHSV